MTMKATKRHFLVTLLTWVTSQVTSFNVSFEKISTLYLPYTFSPSEMYELGKDAAEQMAFHAPSQLLYSVGHTNIQVIDLSDVANMTVLYRVSYSDVDVTDVEVCGSFVFVAFDNQTDRESGFVNVYGEYNKDSNTMELLHTVIVGAIPDMVHPTSNCSRLIVAIEAEPFDTPQGFVDPPGGIGIIKFQDTPAGTYTLTVLGFESFNTRYAELGESGVRFVYRENNNTFSNDVEPEYIAFNHDETKAYITLQENNAIAVVNLQTETIENIFGLGFKNWTQSALDPNDNDGIQLNPWPVYGMYQPDSLKVYTHKGVDYILTANEGDSKDYGFFSEETRVGSVTLSSNFETNSTIRDSLAMALGRLKITTSNGKNETTGKFDKLFTFGGRSFSIWRADTMEQVFDSGMDIGHRISMLKPYLFNNNAETDDLIPATMDKRSDDKGAETESLVTAQIGNYTLVMIGNERPGIVSVYSIDGRLETIQPRFETLLSDIPNVNETWETLYNERRLSMLDPEDLMYVPANESPNGKPLLIASGSFSGTITIYEISVMDEGSQDDSANVSPQFIYHTGLLAACLLTTAIKNFI